MLFCIRKVQLDYSHPLAIYLLGFIKLINSLLMDDVGLLIPNP